MDRQDQDAITPDMLVQLLCWYGGPEADGATNAHPMVQACARRAEALFARDYELLVVANDDLCPTYPPRLLVPVAARGGDPLLTLTAGELHEHMERCRLARARTRFVVPVLLVNQRYLCRSATLSVKGEAMLNGAWDAAARFFSRPKQTQSAPNNKPAALERTDSLISRQRFEDCKLLRLLGVRAIFDLMREHRKVKYGVTVTSSEKADSLNRYAEFCLCGVPYPGTEAFVRFSDEARQASNAETVPAWHQNEAEDAHLFLHRDCAESAAFASFDHYTRWPLRELTTNYARLFLNELCRAPTRAVQRVEFGGAPPSASAPVLGPPPVPSRSLQPRAQQRLSTGFASPPPASTVDFASSPAMPPHIAERAHTSASIVLHCLSGWDRTPLFVSVLRCLAWAQGIAHESLSPIEMVYFTLAYDWLLFRHRLADRMSKREEVLYFAFFFLSFAALDDTLCYRSVPVAPERRERLLHAAALFQRAWFRSREMAAAGGV